MRKKADYRLQRISIEMYISIYLKYLLFICYVCKSKFPSNHDSRAQLLGKEKKKCVCMSDIDKMPLRFPVVPSIYIQSSIIVIKLTRSMDGF